MTPSEHPAREEAGSTRRSLALIVAAWLLAVTACGAAENPAPSDTDSKEAVARLARFEELQDTIIAVSEKVKPTVVHIEAIVRRDGRRAKVTGSGIIIDAEGHILTNHHIVDEEESVTVTIPGEKKKLEAETLGADIQTDVAVIKVNPDKPLAFPKFADSDKVRVGEWVIAIGNPYGLDGTVSFGIVSAKGRNLEVEDLINEFIQTDAMIDHGSSGGPLSNLRGEVVGVNSRGQGRGIGFTIPINTALKVRDQIVASGSIERGYLGVSVQPFDRDIAEHFGLPDATGVIINSVREGSPAEAAGFQAGDLMTRFDGQPVEAEEEKELSKFQRLVANTEVGKSVKVDLLRDGKPVAVTAVIARQPKVQAEEEEARDLGINVKEITESIYISQRLDTMDGVIVSYVEGGTPAAESNLQIGDVIQEMDGKPVKNLAEFTSVLKTTEKSKRFLVKALRG
ncbi:MAG: trypsin-like peptidase domain-containing protein, partial [Deltaproteobacteria bacterium]|nr:trypsin-like peptidase domain-containing protein [Deltaproteobacteria bacterium]